MTEQKFYIKHLHLNESLNYLCLGLHKQCIKKNPYEQMSILCVFFLKFTATISQSMNVYS